MHLYLNYVREHWVEPDQNPPVGLILCAEKGAAEARCALDDLPNKILAAEYQTVLLDEPLIIAELQSTSAALAQRRSAASPGAASTGDDIAIHGLPYRLLPVCREQRAPHDVDRPQAALGCESAKVMAFMPFLRADV